MAYTNVLNMLDLSGLPLESSAREALSPLVVAGGTCCYNPEPLSDFVDLFLIGEGEALNSEVTALYRVAKKEGIGKKAFLRKASEIAGVYVPSLYDVSYQEDGAVASITPHSGVPGTVMKRIMQNLDEAYFPEKAIVPSTEIVHDRVSLEIFRGCVRGCRFCQAGYVYRPVRSRSCDQLIGRGLKPSGAPAMKR